MIEIGATMIQHQVTASTSSILAMLAIMHRHRHGFRDHLHSAMLTSLNVHSRAALPNDKGIKATIIDMLTSWRKVLTQS